MRRRSSSRGICTAATFGALLGFTVSSMVFLSVSHHHAGGPPPSTRDDGAAPMSERCR